MPNSVTKGTVTEETIDRMVQRAFGEKALEMQELKEGYFNIAYRIRLKDRNVVLKIAPSPEIRVMSCEKNIMFSEVDSMRMAAKRTKVPVPRILFYDNSGSVIDREYFFMEMLGGQSLSGLQDALPEEDKQEIYYRLGQYTRQLNHIRGERFGYYGQPDRQGENWYEVFRDMVRDTYADAGRKDIPMPVKEEETLALLEREEQACAEKLGIYQQYPYPEEALSITEAQASEAESRYEIITGRIPAGRWGTGEDMKGTAIFLASAASDYLCGAVIPVDGGYLVK